MESPALGGVFFFMVNRPFNFYRRTDAAMAVFGLLPLWLKGYGQWPLKI